MKIEVVVDDEDIKDVADPQIGIRVVHTLINRIAPVIIKRAYTFDTEEKIDGVAHLLIRRADEFIKSEVEKHN